MNKTRANVKIVRIRQTRLTTHARPVLCFRTVLLLLIYKNKTRTHVHVYPVKWKMSRTFQRKKKIKIFRKYNLGNAVVIIIAILAVKEIHFDGT